MDFTKFSEHFLKKLILVFLLFLFSCAGNDYDYLGYGEDYYPPAVRQSYYDFYSKSNDSTYRNPPQTSKVPQAWQRNVPRAGVYERRPPPVQAPPVSSARRAAPKIRGQSALVMDARSGRVIYEKNSRVRRPVASTQKLLTALVALRRGAAKKKMRVSSWDTKAEPTKLYIRAGETYSGADLLAAMLVKSGNDAARCIARNVAGSESSFAGMMNAYARSIGMRSSNFKNANGLPASGQYSTAYDIALLGRMAYQNSFIRDVVRRKSLRFYYARGGSKLLTNTNKLLSKSSYCVGMKTGYTASSGRCLVSAGVRNGKVVIVVVLKSTSSSIWNDSRALMHWALQL